MMSVDYVGCDPGLDGGFVVVSGDRIKYKMVMPTINFTTEEGKTKMELDRNGILSFLQTRPKHMHIAIEKQSGFRGQDVISNCTLCRGYGILLMGLSAAYLQVTEVSAKTWHDFYGIVNNKKGEGLSTKIQAFEICKRLYPDENFRKSERSKVFHNGLTDATLLATYCQWLFEAPKKEEEE